MLRLCGGTLSSPPEVSPSQPAGGSRGAIRQPVGLEKPPAAMRDRKSTRLNSSHANISYAVFCLKKKKRNSGTDTSLVDSLFSDIKISWPHRRNDKQSANSTLQKTCVDGLCRSSHSSCSCTSIES